MYVKINYLKKGYGENNVWSNLKLYYSCVIATKYELLNEMTSNGKLLNAFKTEICSLFKFVLHKKCIFIP